MREVRGSVMEELGLGMVVAVVVSIDSKLVRKAEQSSVEKVQHVVVLKSNRSRRLMNKCIIRKWRWNTESWNINSCEILTCYDCLANKYDLNTLLWS